MPGVLFDRCVSVNGGKRCRYAVGHSQPHQYWDKVGTHIVWQDEPEYVLPELPDLPDDKLVSGDGV